MKTVSSQDGTKIAYDEQGQGPALILVNGAMTTRSSGTNPELADLLAQHLTVYSFDRRGRGESGDTLPHAVAREIEDIEALIVVAGGTSALYGHSSVPASLWKRPQRSAKGSRGSPCTRLLTTTTPRPNGLGVSTSSN